MSANTMLCDGDCGNVYYEIDLSETCYKQMMCKDCMFTFVAEQGIYIYDESSQRYCPQYKAPGLYARDMQSLL